MDNTQNMKMKKAMTNHEVALLIELIQKTPVLTSRETNATTNKSKDDAWTSLVRVFNAKTGSSVHRSKDQLKFKWDNLKKAARRRTQQMGMNDIKIGDEKPDYISHDEMLEKVTGLLGSNCTEFGGDGNSGGSMVLDNQRKSRIASEKVAANEISEDSEDSKVEDVVETLSRGTPPNKRKRTYYIDLSEGKSTSTESSKYFFDAMPTSKQLLSTDKKGDNYTDNR